MRRRKPGRNRMEDLRKGVYVLPNILTTANLFVGVFSIISSVNGEFHKAAMAIMISSVLDVFDGKIARLTRASSRFGVEYDSLADLVSFGIAPGVLLYEWSLHHMGRLGWLTVFLFVACGALRLARYNVRSSSADSRFFQGLPIPGAAIMAATYVMLLVNAGVVKPSSEHAAGKLAIFMMIGLGLLMVSNVKYRSFKNVDVVKKSPFNFLVALVMFIAVVASKPWIMLFLLSLVYVGSGPVSLAVKLLRAGRAAHKKPSPAVYNDKNHG